MDLSGASFKGYRRPDGTVGVRNLVGIISTVTCANQAAQEISRTIPDSVVFTHQQGCGQTRGDLDLAQRTLTNLGRNPNLGAVLVVSLGCEGVDAEAVAQGVAESGKPVELVRIQLLGGYFGAIRQAGLKAQNLSRAVSTARREEAALSELRLGVKCGASDPTSALASNPAAGAALDQLLEAGGSAVFGETTELIGAEHIIVRRCRDQEVARKMMNMVTALERRITLCGSDIRGGNPSAGNIAAGLSTLEEKSLGAIVKAGTKTINDVLDYGECPPRQPGLYFVDSPGREPELLSALAAAGCQVILFSTGIGAPQGFPFVPVLKISGNAKTVVKLPDFIDVDVSEVMLGRQSPTDAGKVVLAEAVKVCDGLRTKAEAIGYCGSTALHQMGPIL